MSCDKYQEMISAQMDNELSVDEEPSLWEHLAHCENCRAWRREQLTLRDEFAAWPEESLPASAWPLPPAEPVRAYRVPRALAWAAGILLLIEGAWIGRGLVGPRTPDDYSTPDDDTVETIVLTQKDRVSHGVQDFVPDVEPNTPKDKNGG